MNKMIRLFGLFIFSDLLNADHAVAQTAKDEELVQAVLHSVFGPGSKEALFDRVQRSAESIKAQNALRQGLEDEPVAATVIFSSGLNSAEVEEFAAEYDLEIVSAQAKVPTKLPTSDAATVFTLSIGSAVLLLLEKSFPLSTRLDMAIGNQQLILLRAASEGPEAQSSMRKAAFEPAWYFYRVDVIGTESAIAGMLNEPNVAAISADNSGLILSNYHLLKERMSQVKLPPIDSEEHIYARVMPGPPVNWLLVS